MESVSSKSPNEGIDFEQNPFIYGSGYHDNESGLEYMGSRYYSANIGRFVAQDSFDLLNRYNYGNANPIMTIDPDGHFAWGLLPDTWGGAIGMIAGIVAGGVIAGVIGGSLTGGYALFSGVAAGAASGMAGDLVNQGFDRGWSGIQWQEVKFSAFIGAMVGVFSGAAMAKDELSAGKNETNNVKGGEEVATMEKRNSSESTLKREKSNEAGNSYEKREAISDKYRVIINEYHDSLKRREFLHEELAISQRMYTWLWKNSFKLSDEHSGILLSKYMKFGSETLQEIKKLDAIINAYPAKFNQLKLEFNEKLRTQSKI